MHNVAHVVVFFAIVYVLRLATTNRGMGIEWTMFHQQEDINFADDIVEL